MVLTLLKVSKPTHSFAKWLRLETLFSAGALLATSGGLACPPVSSAPGLRSWMRVKPPGRATPVGLWPPPAWVDGGQILKEYVPLLARKLGLFSEGETVRETGEDVELLWMFCWIGPKDWTGWDI